MTCWDCNSLIDGATEINANEERKPQDGDLSLCLYCASIGVFSIADGVVRSRKPSQAETERFARSVDLVNTVGLTTLHRALLDDADRPRYDRPAPCKMTHTEPFDFAQCDVHDTTFPLGGVCEWHGVDSIAGHLQGKADNLQDQVAVLKRQLEHRRQEINEPPGGCTNKGCGRPMAEHDYGQFCP